jgi:hypothetical protein
MTMVMMVMAMMVVMMPEHDAATLVNVKAMRVIGANDPRAEVHLRRFRRKANT